MQKKKLIISNNKKVIIIVIKMTKKMGRITDWKRNKF